MKIMGDYPLTKQMPRIAVTLAWSADILELLIHPYEPPASNFLCVYKIY